MKKSLQIQLLSVAVIALGLFFLPKDAQAEEGCVAGGPGASQCSVTINGFSCGVTCAAGNYACCGEGGCHCIAET